jgi:hypothetical protein
LISAKSDVAYARIYDQNVLVAEKKRKAANRSARLVAPWRATIE